MEQQEVIFRLSLMEQQMNQLQEQLQAIERGINELQSLNLGLDELRNSNDKDIMAQVGKGIYVRAKITSEELMVNIGENDFVARNVKEAKEMIMKQIVKLSGVKNDLNKTIEMTNNEFMDLISQYENPEK